ncbi:MAG: alpha/beta fold hydrolase [Nevskiales bacterium]|nr:alpha/beta fold hydrolase [Nevskiales bacterium]
MRVAALCVASSAVACTGGSDPVAQQLEQLQQQVTAKAYDAQIQSPVADNASGAATTMIAASVFVPAHAPGATYPLIIHSHGWGGDRITPQDAADNAPNDEPTDFYSVVLDRQIKHLWDAGYAVISFDERGFHDSAGASRVMDPAYETRDAIAILDWAEANLDLARDDSGDPLIGSLGGSYGGGFQLLLAALDPRVDALVPGATWNDLVDALVPNGVVKKLYAFGLCFSAVQAGRTLDTPTQKACTQSGYDPLIRFAEGVSPDVLEFLHGHGLRAMQERHDNPADPFRMRRVDALFVQGNRDVLFPINQALANVRFLSGLGGDIRLMTNEHGHFIPPPLSSQPGPGWWGCGPYDSTQVLQDWFDAKLRGQTDKLAQIPRVCLSLDDAHAVTLPELPIADDSHVVNIEPTTVTGAQNDFAGLPATFVALAGAGDLSGYVLAGVPVANLNVESTIPGTEGTAFVGIGIRHADGSVSLVDDQINPLRSSDTHQFRELIAVGERLQSGDVPGILLYGAFHQYEPAVPVNFLTNAYTISGTVALPLAQLDVLERTP